MKADILHALRRHSETGISGETLSGLLGISRVSIWKHMKKLQEMGYGIEASATGYRLLDAPDIPYPWEFPGWEDNIHYFETVSSTMDVAREMARKGCPDFTVVIAGVQTRGRGRLSRKWESDDGGLYMTLVLRPNVPPMWAGRLNFVASVALCRTLSAVAGIDAGTKWPNDILVEGKKISGMLSEMEAESDRVSHVAIGIGVNVNNDPTGKEPGATSLRLLCARPISRVAIVGEFLSRLAARMADAPFTGAVEAWKRHTCTLGKPVKIATVDRVVEGRAIDVDEDGALVLALADGTIQRVVYGDCFHG